MGRGGCLVWWWNVNVIFCSVQCSYAAFFFSHTAERTNFLLWHKLNWQISNSVDFEECVRNAPIMYPNPALRERLGITALSELNHFLFCIVSYYVTSRGKKWNQVKTQHLIPLNLQVEHMKNACPTKNNPANMQIFFRWQFTDIAGKTWLCLNEKIASDSVNEGRYCTIHANLSGSKLAKAVSTTKQQKP